jgi:hypothetical protein
MTRVRGLETAVGMCLVGILGLGVMEVLPDVSLVSPHRMPLAYWALVAISLALCVIGFVWLFTLRARLRREVIARDSSGSTPAPHPGSSPTRPAPPR